MSHDNLENLKTVVEPLNISGEIREIAKGVKISNPDMEISKIGVIAESQHMVSSIVSRFEKKISKKPENKRPLLPTRIEEPNRGSYRSSLGEAQKDSFVKSGSQSQRNSNIELNVDKNSITSLGENPNDNKTINLEKMLDFDDDDDDDNKDPNASESIKKYIDLKHGLQSKLNSLITSNSIRESQFQPIEKSNFNATGANKIFQPNISLVESTEIVLPSYITQNKHLNELIPHHQSDAKIIGLEGCGLITGNGKNFNQTIKPTVNGISSLDKQINTTNIFNKGDSQSSSNIGGILAKIQESNDKIEDFSPNFRKDQNNDFLGQISMHYSSNFSMPHNLQQSLIAKNKMDIIKSPIKNTSPQSNGNSEIDLNNLGKSEEIKDLNEKSALKPNNVFINSQFSDFNSKVLLKDSYTLNPAATMVSSDFVGPSKITDFNTFIPNASVSKVEIINDNPNAPTLQNKQSNEEQSFLISSVLHQEGPKFNSNNINTNQINQNLQGFNTNSSNDSDLINCATKSIDNSVKNLNRSLSDEIMQEKAKQLAASHMGKIGKKTRDLGVICEEDSLRYSKSKISEVMSEESLKLSKQANEHLEPANQSNLAKSSFGDFLPEVPLFESKIGNYNQTDAGRSYNSVKKTDTDEFYPIQTNPSILFNITTNSKSSTEVFKEKTVENSQLTEKTKSSVLRQYYKFAEPKFISSCEMIENIKQNDEKSEQTMDLSTSNSLKFSNKGQNKDKIPSIGLEASVKSTNSITFDPHNTIKTNEAIANGKSLSTLMKSSDTFAEERDTLKLPINNSKRNENPSLSEYLKGSETFEQGYLETNSKITNYPVESKSLSSLLRTSKTFVDLENRSTLYANISKKSDDLNFLEVPLQNSEVFGTNFPSESKQPEIRSQSVILQNSLNFDNGLVQCNSPMKPPIFTKIEANNNDRTSQHFQTSNQKAQPQILPIKAVQSTQLPTITESYMKALTRNFSAEFPVDLSSFPPEWDNNKNPTNNMSSNQSKSKTHIKDEDLINTSKANVASVIDNDGKIGCLRSPQENNNENQIEISKMEDNDKFTIPLEINEEEPLTGI